MNDDSYLLEIVARLRDETAAGIDNLKRRIDDLKAHAAAADLSSGVSDLADEADRAAQSHENLTRQQEAHRRTVEQSRTAQIQQGKYLAEGAEQAGAQAESVGELNEQHAELRRQAPQTTSALRQVGQAHGEGEAGAARQAAATSDLGAAMDQASESVSRLSKAQQQASQRGDELIQKMGQLDTAAKAHTASNRELEVGYRQVASGLRSVYREMDLGSESADRFGQAMERAEQRASNTDLARASNGFTQFAQQVASATDGIMPKIVSLSAELRGLRLVLSVAMVQPLISGLDSLAGGFFSVASGATQAAATVGGVFVSGLGQLMPVMSVAMAGLEGLKTVFQAVQAVMAEQQENYLAPNQGMITQLSTTNALVEAEENLRNAYVQVREAQEQLLESTLQITQARASLVEAEHSGSQMAIAQAKQQLDAAKTARQEAVIGVANARQGVPEAQRQIQIERLTAAEPTSYETSQQATVQYLESLMSPVEKQLFQQLTNLDLELKQPGSPLNKIASDFLEPFTRLAGRLQSLLGDSSFLSPIYKLAQSMEKAGDSMTKTVFGSGGTSFFTTMADDATKSIPIITKALEGFLKLMGDVAKAAAPAFDRLSKDWANFWTGLTDKEGSAAGQQRLTQFFDKGARWAEDFAHLAHAIVDLFMALGHDAAPQGMKTVTSLSGAVESTTNWVQTHGKQVTDFFQQANQGLQVIGGMLLQVGKLLVQAFSLSSLQAFSSLLTGLVLPGFKDFVDVVGKLMNLVMDLLGHLGPLRQILEAGIGVAFALTAFGKLVGIVTKTTDVVAAFYDGFKALRAGEGILNSLGAAWTAFTTRITKGKTAINEVKQAQDELATTTATTDTEMAAEDQALWEKIASEGVGAEGSEITAAGSAGLLSTLGVGALRALPILGGGMLAAQLAGLNDITAGKSVGGYLKSAGSGALAGGAAGAAAGSVVPGLGTLIGGGVGAVAGGASGLISDLLFGKSNSGAEQVNSQITKLKDGLKGYGSALEIPAAKLKTLYDRASQLAGESDITAKQRASLEKLSQTLDPVLVKVEKIKDTWASSFGGISSLTGNVMQQVSQTLSQNLTQISTNMGTKTQGGVSALQGSIVGAVSTVMQNTTKMVRDTSSKMTQLNAVLGHALKSLGIDIAPHVLSHLDLPQIEAISKGAFAGSHLKITSLSQALAAVKSEGGAATGAWHDASPGGKLMNVGEAGYPEVTLTTDPRHSARSGALLGRYLQHMAVGGSVAVPQVTGVAGIPGILAQGDVDLVAGLMYGALGVGASSAKPGKMVAGSRAPLLSAITSGGVSSAISGVKNGSWYAVASQIAKKMGWGSSEITAWQGVEGIEDSSLSLTAKNPTSPAYGLAQFIDGPGEYYRYGGNPSTIVGQLTAMANYIKERYGTPAGALVHEHLHGWYARGGLIADHVRRIGLRHLRRKVLHMASGGRAPWGGEPVPIVAHEGEHVVNPGQWDHIAGMTGMSGHQLDDHMGYSSGRPRQFAPGGLVPYTSAQGAPRASGAFKIPTTANTGPSAVSQNASWTLDFTGVSSALGALEDLFTAVNKGLRSIGKLGGSDITTQTKKLTNLIGNFADPNLTDSALNNVNTAFQSYQNNITSWLTNVSYLGKTIAGTRIGRQRSNGSVAGSGDDLRIVGPQLTAGNVGSTGTTGIDLMTERSYSEQYQYLGTENKSIQAGISKVKSTISTVKTARSNATSSSERDKYTKSLTKLEQSYSELVQQQQNLSTSMASIVSERFQTEQQYVQDAVDQISDVYQTQQSQLQGKQSTQETMGRFGGASSTDTALARSAKSQIAALQKPLQEAKSQHDADAVAQIQQQIADLRQTISQNVNQMIQDEVSGISQTFQTQQTQIQSSQAGAEALGNFAQLPSIDQMLATSAQNQIQALQAPLQQALSRNDQSAVAQIQQQIAELQETVTQSVAQMIQDAISGIQQTAQTASAQSSMQQSIAQSMQQNATTPGQFQAAGQLMAQSYSTSNASILSQISQYTGLNLTASNASSVLDQIASGNYSGVGGLLGQSISTGNVGAQNTIVQTLDQLNSTLVTNNQALSDNTAQVVSQTAAFLQNQGQFQTGSLGALSQIITTIGQTTGFTDVGSLKQLATASNTSLQSTNQGLLAQLAQLGGGAAGLAGTLGQASSPQAFVSALSGANLGSITSGMDQTQLQTFDTLIQDLETNTEAIATNNQQLAQLNGQLLQPQQFSTSAFTAFRDSMFTGMGNLLPQYQGALTGTGYQPTIAPIFGGVAGSGVIPAIGNLSINHVPASTVQPAILGEQLLHEMTGALT